MILYNIIQSWLFLNMLQRIIVEEVLSYTMSNKGYSYQDKAN